MEVVVERGVEHLVGAAGGAEGGERQDGDEGASPRRGCEARRGVTEPHRDPRSEREEGERAGDEEGPQGELGCGGTAEEEPRDDAHEGEEGDGQRRRREAPTRGRGVLAPRASPGVDLRHPPSLNGGDEHTGRRADGRDQEHAPNEEVEALDVGRDQPERRPRIEDGEEGSGESPVNGPHEAGHLPVPSHDLRLLASRRGERELFARPSRTAARR